MVPRAVSDKTPMGQPIDIFDGASVDRSFASQAMLMTDRVEMSMWLTRNISNYHLSLGGEVQALLEGAEDQVHASPKRLQVTYVAGVEGTGHHGFMPMLLYAAVRAFGSGVLAWWRSLREVFLYTPVRQRRAKLATLLANMDVAAYPHIIFEWCSWPFGEEFRERWCQGCQDARGLSREERSGNPGNSVDLLEFVDLFSEHGDVRVLVLHRNLVSSSWSHREWDGGLLPHARVLALFNDYLTKVLVSLKSANWKWIRYEDVCDAHNNNDFDAIFPLADFLRLPRDMLRRSFQHFSPSRKDAAAEMPRASLKVIRALERQKSSEWFPERCPEQQILAKRSSTHIQQQAPVASTSRREEVCLQSPTDITFERWAKSLSNAQTDLFNQMMQSQESLDSEAQRRAMDKLEAALSDDQAFEWRRILTRQEVDRILDETDVDPTAFIALRMVLEGRGFGSEVNNLISAAIYCDEHGIDCIVEDKPWNAGRLHDYFQAEPLIKPSAHLSGRCHRVMEVKREKGVATQGWFAVQKHARAVGFEEKSRYAQRICRLTPAAEEAVEELNQELALPLFYVCVHIRRGDKVKGERREAVGIATSAYVRAVLGVFGAPSEAVVVCTDDLAAAEDFAAELARRKPGTDVRWRRRQRQGHWQAEWNAQPLRERVRLTHEFLADVDVMRGAHFCICSHSSNVGRLVALLREERTISLDEDWTNT